MFVQSPLQHTFGQSFLISAVRWPFKMGTAFLDVFDDRLQASSLRGSGGSDQPCLGSWWPLAKVEEDWGIWTKYDESTEYIKIFKIKWPVVHISHCLLMSWLEISPGFLWKRFWYCNGHALKGDLGDCSTGPATNLFCILVAWLELWTTRVWVNWRGHLQHFRVSFIGKVPADDWDPAADEWGLSFPQRIFGVGGLAEVELQICKTRAEGRRM